jgi:pimeloyl-ACP methyl ester carboxylesterase
MKTEIAPNCRMEYDDVGEGRTVVLLHAFPLSRRMWRLQIMGLRNAYRVLAPDLRGFGGTSGFDGTPSIDQMADDVAALLNRLRLQEPVVVGGLSMGGYGALAFARRHPSRLRALILADTRAEPDSDEARGNRDKLIAFTESHTARDVIDQMLPKLITNETLASRHGIAEEIIWIGAAQTSEGIIGGLHALRDRPDARPMLATITVPTLVLVGKEDVLTPPAMAEALVAGIAGSQLVTIPEAGHLSNMEQPEVFNSHLRAFLQGLP